MNDGVQVVHSESKPSKPAKPRPQKKGSIVSKCVCKKKDAGQSIDAEKPTQELRHIVVDVAKAPQDVKENINYCDNRISTTKYSILSFIPKSLLVQFKRVSNCYFLATAVLCSIPSFSPLPPYTSITPLVFVLFMSMLREAYEDFKRRTNDKLTNNKPCRILKNRDNQKIQGAQIGSEELLSNQMACNYRHLFKQSIWGDVRCGDLVLIEEGESIPSDMVLLLSSSENGEYGERALKHKQVQAPIIKAVESEGLQYFSCSLFCEQPSKSLYDFNGYMESELFQEAGTVSLHPESKKRILNLDSKSLVLRGSNIANTSWAIGAIVYTGRESKLMLNQGLSRFKQSKIERLINMICIVLIIIQAILCLIMSLFSGFFISNYGSTDSNSKQKAEYLFFVEATRTASTNFTDSTISPTLTGVSTYGQFFVLLNTLIPISLVVSIEFVKLIQTPYFSHDLKMYDEVQMKQMQPISMTLHEELASVDYIFADKTGTLTSNIMQFKACTIGSVCYDEDYRDEDYEYIVGTEGPDQMFGEVNQAPILMQDIEEAKEEEEQESKDGIAKAEEFEQFKSKTGEPFNTQGEFSKMNRRNSITEILWDYKESVQVIRDLLETKKFFLNEEINLGVSDPFTPPIILQKQNDYLKQFWMNIAICHDVITCFNKVTQKLTYQGQSPDEITLLDAAKEIGFIFTDRNSDSIKINVFGKIQTYKVLHKVEFSSDRKKMSVVVQDEETNHLILYSKGADLAIFERLSTNIEQPFLEATKEDLIKFSTKGFRTLCFAMRVLDTVYFTDWQERYFNARLDEIKQGVAKDKSEKLNKGAIELLDAELEQELFLLGATALEDKLQEGVPEVIDDFHQAGIKVWMLTGDKLETAENIGFSSKMFNEKMYIFKLETNDKATTRQRLLQIDSKIALIEKQNQTPIIGTQFILNPNAGTEFEFPQDPLNPLNGQNDSKEAKNIIKALEEYKHESRNSEYTMNESWARKPALRRKARKRIEEIVPDKNAIIEKLIRENQIFYKDNSEQLKYIPDSFDMGAKQYIVNQNNVYRSASSMKGKMSVGKDSVDNEDSFGILVEGKTLQFIIDSQSMKKKFLGILGRCQAVIVCRASPSQKAMVVQIVKENEPKCITLAIGDGANDVNMILNAHIGVGIYGKEGYQAANNSDYAIGQFRFLRRLMFVHGRWCGVRLSTFITFFFQKNIIFTLPQFFFGWFSAYSGQTFFDNFYLTYDLVSQFAYRMFNSTVTAVAVCSLGIWDIDIHEEDPETLPFVKLAYPYLYKYSAQNEIFTYQKFYAWSAISTLQSIVLFAGPLLSYYSYQLNGGQTEDLWATSTNAYFSLVFMHYLLIFFFTKNWTWFICFMYTGSFIFFCPGLIIVDDYIPYQAMEGRLNEIAGFTNYSFWASLFLTLGAMILPLIFYYNVKALLFPTLKDLIMQKRIDFNKIMKEADPQKVQSTHDLFKFKQQQQLLKWQMEYNYNTSPSRKVDPAEIEILDEEQKNNDYASDSVDGRHKKVTTPVKQKAAKKRSSSFTMESPMMNISQRKGNKKNSEQRRSNLTQTSVKSVNHNENLVFEESKEIDFFRSNQILDSGRTLQSENFVDESLVNEPVVEMMVQYTYEVQGMKGSQAPSIVLPKKSSRRTPSKNKFLK